MSQESVYKFQLQLCVLVSVVQRNRPMGKRYVHVYIYIIYLTLRDFKKSTTITDKYVMYMFDEYIYIYTHYIWGFPCGSVVRICLPVQEMQELQVDPWVGRIPWRRK